MTGPVEEIALLEIYVSERDEEQQEAWRARKYIEAWRAGVLAQQARVRLAAIQEKEGLA